MCTKNISSLAIVLLLINFNTNVNSEMRKSWSRKTVLNETEKTEPLTSQDIMKYFRADQTNSDFESVFSDKSDLKEHQLTTETDKVAITEIPEMQSDDFENIDSAEIISKDESVKTEKVNEESNEIPKEPESKSTSEKHNMTQEERDTIREGLNLIVLGRGKKNNWVERIVPLFILPFLIQSAIIPFMVQTIKLLLLKSLFVGKAALLLFLLGFFKNVKGGHHHRSGHPYYVNPGSGPDDRIYQPEYASEHGYQAEGAPYFVHKRSSNTKN